MVFSKAQETMMVARFLVMIVLCLLSRLSGIADDKPKSDVQLFQGSWDWDPAAKQSDSKILVEKVVIKGDTLTIHYNLNGKRNTTPTKFRLDSKATPKEIDFTPTEKNAANRGQTYLGLYEVRAGQLMICYRGPGSTRPKDFKDKSAGNDATVYIVLKPSPVS
ncbi:MAG: TIGR03067 domain-containing protein [Gemmatales bacterium]